MMEVKMKVNTQAVIERSIEVGVKRGYQLAFKHTDSPEEPAILDSISNEIWFELDTYFQFED